MLNQLINDEAGMLVSAEFLLIATLVFCGTAVGFASIRDSLVGELHDVSEAIGSVNQSVHVRGIRKPTSNPNSFHCECSGFGFNDRRDSCDCDPIVFVTPAVKADPNGTGHPDGA